MANAKKSMPFLISALIFISSAAVLFWWCRSYSTWSIRDQLTRISPLFLEINFILIIIAIILNLLSFKRLSGFLEKTPVGEFRKASRFVELITGVPKHIWVMLGAVCAVGAILLFFVIPRDHRIYYDEDIYQNIGQNIAGTKGDGSHHGENYTESFKSVWKRFVGRAGMCNEGRNQYGEYSCYRLEYNKEPNGWAFVLSVVYRLFGVHEQVSFTTSNSIYLIAVLVVFLSGTMLFNSSLTGLYAAMIFAFTPEVLIWSNTVAVEPSAAFFAALAVLCTLYYLKVGSSAALWLCALVTAFAVQFRPESLMICGVIGLMFLFVGRSNFRQGRVYLAASIMFVLLVPHFAHLWAVREMGWGSSGNKFFVTMGGPWYRPFVVDEVGLLSNLKVNTLFYFRNMRFPLLFTAFFLTGVLAPARKKSLIGVKLVLLAWFTLFWGIFILFYAGSYNYGADVRFSVLSSIPIALLGGSGVCFLLEYAKRRWCVPAGAIVTVLILLSCLTFLPFLRAITQEAWAARADHKYAKKMAEVLPPDSVVLTHNPNMFLLWGKNAAQASLATEKRSYFNNFFQRYQGGIYFHYNFWCNVSDELQTSFCKNILKRFNCTEVMRFKERNYEFALYKVEKQK